MNNKTLQFVTKELTVQEQHEYEQKASKFLVCNPWKDPFCKKNGLFHMYIESSIAEILQLRAESDPGSKMCCPNPVYTKFHELLKECFKITSFDEHFKELVTFLVDEVIHRPLKIINWTGFVPDIRLVDTIEEALGCLVCYLRY